MKKKPQQFIHKFFITKNPDPLKYNWSEHVAKKNMSWNFGPQKTNSFQVLQIGENFHEILSDKHFRHLFFLKSEFIKDLQYCQALFKIGPIFLSWDVSSY